MQLNIVARHLELTQAIADYVRKKVEKSEKYFQKIVWAQVILSVEKYRQLAEIVLHAGGSTFRSKEESIDLYAAIDLAADKIDAQLRRYKEKSKVHRKSKDNAAKREKLGISFTTSSKDKHFVSEVKRFDIKPFSVSKAIDEMKHQGYSFFMFLNSETSHINVVYKKDNSSYGLLEPQIS